VNVITWLIHFAFNEAECLGMQQLKHCTFGEEKKKRKKDRNFLWESWDVGDTIPASTQSASRIIQEKGLG